MNLNSNQVARFKQLLLERIQQQVDVLEAGNMPSLEAYKERVGWIRGLKDGLSIIDQVIKEAEQQR